VTGRPLRTVVLAVAISVLMGAAVGGLSQMTAVSDVRWARLTRWRSLVAQFFDVPDVRAARYESP